ncbi:Glyoxalase/Bleomycin resistance protein/Dihydroxybiphenyl dioxygenase [Zopfia rhizophila CBS 207.26]|uniref:Glyoxalase/Bleomycin resistance protein/Dihydroxybiphenyl dioxygenase n=1 Tax=Zopfia rhizophila CBS 207.26 TaxID=1314779 RepID=A0A6A6E6U4_9PEZI|nr:Glyoxalase/Bleomycin resistance protein/Dihydroxybiphenyl dioxygenase [Zopfia rhizophila CBS 207.26]
MLGHVSIRVLDLEASLQFYLAALSPLSYKEMRFPSVIGLGSSNSTAPIPDFWLRQYTPCDKNSHVEKPTPVHISFYVKERRLVDEFYASGIKAGGKDNGKPGVRPWMGGYYAAYILDLDGNNIEVVYFATEAESAEQGGG